MESGQVRLWAGICALSVHVRVDGGYAGRFVRDGQRIWRLVIEVVKRFGQHTAWLTNHRRLVCDDETLPETREGLKGTGLVSGVSYRAVELSGTVVNQLPPPGTGTFFSTVTTLLIPQGSAAPSMLLLVVVKATVAPDGTISNEVVQTYLVCRPRGAGLAS